MGLAYEKMVVGIQTAGYFLVMVASEGPLSKQVWFVFAGQVRCVKIEPAKLVKPESGLEVKSGQLPSLPRLLLLLLPNITWIEFREH